VTNGWFMEDDDGAGLNALLATFGVPSSELPVPNHKIRLAKQQWQQNVLTFEQNFQDRQVTNFLCVGEVNDVEVYPGLIKRIMLEQVDEYNYTWSFDGKVVTLSFSEPGATWV